ncbi:hypothetical protein DERF_005178 [Dermatophagoides farinae]|uniref:Uncharacterized protein n=1 Tax=Dermatophagoides farinae TaxID=6954 RepID=A0A922L6B2_DERFA|nr:hypothetical protein DERF_005178 [Dermatophagoides farinae]
MTIMSFCNYCMTNLRRHLLINFGNYYWRIDKRFNIVHRCPLFSTLLDNLSSSK